MLENGHYIRAGIEFDAIGRRVAYHLYRDHPGDALHPAHSTEVVPVPARYVLHLFRPLRPGQLRGQPWLTQVLVKLYELDQYDDAELVRKKTAAMFAGFITKTAPDNPVMAEEKEDGDASGTALTGLEPGTLQVLLPGEDVRFSAPADVGASYETFMRVQLRSIAAGMGITYEQLTGDLTGVNYSSIRAGLLEFRRRCEQFQHQVLVYQMCRPIWQRWVTDAILSGALEIPEPAKLVAKWVPPGFAWVDPLKDIKAQIMAVRAGFKSRSEVVSEQGYDAEVIDREIANDNARADSLGLEYESDARKKERNEPSTSSGDANL
jgi:lambda family phage portal protein